MPMDQIRAFSEDLALVYEWFISTGYSIDIEQLPTTTVVQRGERAPWTLTPEQRRRPVTSAGDWKTLSWRCCRKSRSQD